MIASSIYQRTRYLPFALACLILAGCGSQTYVEPKVRSLDSPRSLDERNVSPASLRTERRVRPLSVIMPELNSIVNQQPRNPKPFNSAICIEAMLAAEKVKHTELLLSVAGRCDANAFNTSDRELYYLKYQNSLQEKSFWTRSMQVFESNDYLQKHILFSENAKIELTLLEAQALEMLGDHWSAAQARATLLGKTQRKPQPSQVSQLLKRNDQELWNNLLFISHEDIVRHARSTPRSPLRSWLELVEILKNPRLSAPERSDAIELWERSWSDRNLLGNWQPPANLRKTKNAATREITQLAVVIPLSGPLAKAGRAVQSGLIAANIESQTSGSSTTRLKFYDSHNQMFEAMYSRAVREGAHAIIGPLAKSRVEQLHTSLTEIPVLALNYVADSLPPPENVIQFGLATEDEAKQLAMFATQADIGSVLVLHTGKDWAQRAAQSFEDHWANTGGQSTRQLLRSEESYQTEIASALGVQLSKQRKSQIQGLLGKQVEFNPRRRQDVDAVVVFSNDRQLAIIKPLLAYHYAGDLPVLSSSRAYSANEKNYRDLAGVLFVDIPFLLEQNRYSKKISKSIKENYQLSRLFAMGVDAYNLTPELALMSTLRQGGWSGLTGELSLDRQRLNRKLSGATINRNGSKAITNSEFISKLAD